VADPVIDFVLFDLGGVLIELGDVTRLQEMSEVVGTEEIWQQWLASPWVRRFEKGQCSETEFSAGVIAEWGVDIAPRRFLEIFRDWPMGPYPGTTELLAELKRLVPVGCLSNTNAMHWEHQTSVWPMLDMLDFRFLSFELGLAKPDEAIFHAVDQRLPFCRERVLYFDDVAANAETAMSFGFRSVQVRGIEEAATVLHEVGLLST
jgi:putative hydrolase of the HAD superfamily